jgi:hypothetical protein
MSTYTSLLLQSSEALTLGVGAVAANSAGAFSLAWMRWSA